MMPSPHCPSSPSAFGRTGPRVMTAGEMALHFAWATEQSWPWWRGTGKTALRVRVLESWPLNLSARRWLGHVLCPLNPHHLRLS